MAGNISQKVELFKRLDDERALGALSPEGEVLWQELREELELSAAPSEDIPPSSRRFAVRVPAQLDVSFEDARGFNKAYLRNISEGGVYVESDLPLEMGHRFQLTIQVTQPQKTLELPVEVVWVNRNPTESSGLKGGVGVAFLDLDPAHKQEIKALIHHALDVMVDSSAAPEAATDDAAPVSEEPEPSTKRLPRDDD
ncbi:MAG: PilZ domain-containing protein [Deltaproteobacteria bacterium]|nr:PilZ domain-containing protein [Deltaproteobacteria bacterium]